MQNHIVSLLFVMERLRISLYDKYLVRKVDNTISDIAILLCLATGWMCLYMNDEERKWQRVKRNISPSPFSVPYLSSSMRTYIVETSDPVVIAYQSCNRFWNPSNEDVDVREFIPFLILSVLFEWIHLSYLRLKEKIG
jgi:hypothetical protein